MSHSPNKKEGGWEGEREREKGEEGRGERKGMMQSWFSLLLCSLMLEEVSAQPVFWRCCVALDKTFALSGPLKKQTLKAPTFGMPGFSGAWDSNGVSREPSA